MMGLELEARQADGHLVLVQWEEREHGHKMGAGVAEQAPCGRHRRGAS